MADDKKLSGTELDEFMATARKRFDQCVEDEKDIREAALEDLKMESGDQWDSGVKAARDAAGRACLTFNREHTFVQQVSNEARQNKPQIKFVPAEDGDKDEAEAKEGLARHIQYDSDAQVAYETGVEYSAACSFGHYGIITEYCDNKSFDQDVKIRCFPDPFAVYGILYPSCFGREPKFAFVTSHISKEDYEREYPDSELASLNWDDAKEECSGWVTDEGVRIAEYWVVEEKREKLKKGNKERWVVNSKVCCYKINGKEILEDSEWAGSAIPIIPILGKLRIIDGKPRLISVTRFQHAAQKLINSYKTRIAETMGTAPIQPYLVAKGQIAPEDAVAWAQMNTKQMPYLVYSPVDANGQPVPAPQRQVFEPPITSLSNAAGMEIDDMKATAGIYDASMGSTGNETSGVAIQRRQQQSNITNMHFMDNLERAFKKGGVMIAELLDKIYDTPRMIRILGEDEAPKIVKINQDAKKEGEKSYKFGSDAKFDIVVTMGRSFSTKRMESFDMMTSIIQANPAVLQMVGDLFFKNSDLAGADQMSERFKLMLPPQIQQAEEQKNGENNVPPEIQAKLQASDQQMQQMGQALQEAQNPLKVKEMELQGAQLQQQHEKDMAAAKFQHELEMKQMDIQLASKNKDAELKARLSGEVMKHDTAEAIQEHKSEAAAALEVYKTEAQLKMKQIDRDAAAQVQEAQEATQTAQTLDGK